MWPPLVLGYGQSAEADLNTPQKAAASDFRGLLFAEVNDRTIWYLQSTLFILNQSIVQVKAD